MTSKLHFPYDNAPVKTEPKSFNVGDIIHIKTKKNPMHMFQIWSINGDDGMYMSNVEVELFDMCDPIKGEEFRETTMLELYNKLQEPGAEVFNVGGKDLDNTRGK